MIAPADKPTIAKKVVFLDFSNNLFKNFEVKNNPTKNPTINAAYIPKILGFCFQYSRWNEPIKALKYPIIIKKAEADSPGTT